MSALRLFVLLIGLCGLTPSVSLGHALEPGYLEITAIAGDSHRVFWRKPDVQGGPMQIDARLPETCDPATGPAATNDSRAWVTVWVATCPGGLAGGEIRIDGLDLQRTDVLVRYPGADGAMQSQRLTADQPGFIVPQNPSAFDVVWTYLPLGIEHILSGIDHLLFVFALLLLIPSVGRLVGAITAFTIAHSITMAAATLGWVTLPGPPVEAIIALSIMFVAAELLQRDGSGQRLSERYPWTVSFSFGLLHGFGFAGALRDIGLPQTDVPLALMSFNIGVEVGQLSFIAVVLLLGYAMRRVTPAMRSLTVPGAPVAVGMAYAIGGVSAYWFLDRVSGF